MRRNHHHRPQLLHLVAITTALLACACSFSAPPRRQDRRRPFGSGGSSAPSSASPASSSFFRSSPHRPLETVRGGAASADPAQPIEEGSTVRDALLSSPPPLRTHGAVDAADDSGIQVTATHNPSNLRERMEPVCEYHEISVAPPTLSEAGAQLEEEEASVPQQVISTRDLTPTLKQLISLSGIRHGTMTVISRHTTTSVVVNEHEVRLARDLSNHLLKLAPIDERSASPMRALGVRYLHNDIDERPDSHEEFQRCLENGYDVRDPEVLQEWRDQEPINAHSHLLSMLLGSSESIPIVNGTMALGRWQSVLLVDLDGPRTRTVGVNLMGYR